MIHHKVRIDNSMPQTVVWWKPSVLVPVVILSFLNKKNADWTANSYAKTWCIQCMKMLKELWTKQLHDNNILLIMKCFAYRYIPLLPNVWYMQYIQYMHGLMSSCNNNLYTCGEILDLSQNSVDFAPRGPVVILNVAV